jgi:hypothetical protein
MPVTITGLEPLFRKLGAAASVQTLTPPMQRGVMRLHSFMAVYPPPPSGSKYIRGYGFPGRPTSEKYGQRWTTKVTASASGLVGKVGNNASYGPYVGSSRFQTRQHAGSGWHTDAQAVAANEDVILADFQQAVDRALAG